LSGNPAFLARLLHPVKKPGGDPPEIASLTTINQNFIIQFQAHSLTKSAPSFGIQLEYLFHQIAVGKQVAHIKTDP
jgi:hypothetical protein